MLEQALQQLDPNNDDHWTGEGLPRLDVVRMLSGASTLTREQVSQAAPGLTRAAQHAYKASQQAPDAGVQAPEVETQPEHAQAEPEAQTGRARVGNAGG